MAVSRYKDFIAGDIRINMGSNLVRNEIGVRDMTNTPHDRKLIEKRQVS